LGPNPGEGPLRTVQRPIDQRAYLPALLWLHIV